MDGLAITIVIVTAAATGAIAVADLVHAGFVLTNSANVGVPESWLTPLGLLKGAGAAGLLLGLAGVPLVGEAAALGLSAFFVCAVITHLRAHEYSLHFPGAFLALAVVSAAVMLG